MVQQRLRTTTRLLTSHVIPSSPCGGFRVIFASRISFDLSPTCCKQLAVLVMSGRSKDMG